jgi:diacylglycerol kinase (ATP)
LIENKWFAIINPVSGMGKAGKKWEYIKGLLEKNDISFNFGFTSPDVKGDLVVQDAIGMGYRKIICVGGDGNLHDIMNGIMTQQHCPTTDVLVAIISLGTGNDWIKTSGVPLKIEAAVALLKTGKPFLQDVGIATYFVDGKQQQRYFHNFAGVGFDAYVVQRTAKLKKYGQIAYLLSMFKCLFTYTKPTVKVIAGDKIVETPIYMALGGIGKYGGGGMKLMPGAVVDDGKLYLTLAKQLSIPQIMIHTPSLYSGTFLKLKEVEVIEAESIKVEPVKGEVFMEADGDLLGTGPFTLNIIPKAFKVLVP